MTVAGENADDKENYIFQSIATRGFERHFGLADHVEVEGAAFENGLLQIDLVRKVPEAMKRRRIEINVGHAAPRSHKTLDAKDAQARPGIKAA